MSTKAFERDVQEKLMNARVSRRQQGEIIYPFEYTNAMADFDIWEHMFLTQCCQGLSLTVFDSPPKTVLDLGCGGGFWAIEAAKNWPNSIVVGYDIADVQPHLAAMGQHRDLARRVKWVHGNFLDGLPFPPAHFDFVRISNIGLGVPEDEWQTLLEEVARVMKSRAVIEIFEEDLIFPCSRSKDYAPPVSFPPSTIPLGIKTSNISSGQRSPDERTSPVALKSKPSLSNLLSSKSLRSPLKSPKTVASTDTLSSISSPTQTFASQSLSYSSIQSSFTSSPQISSTYCSSQTFSDASSDSAASYLQNHSRLEAAWDNMLSKKFLRPTVVNVIPFYIGLLFIDFRTHIPCRVPLPPNSNCQESFEASLGSSDENSDSMTADSPYQRIAKYSYSSTPDRYTEASNFCRISILSRRHSEAPPVPTIDTSFGHSPSPSSAFVHDQSPRFPPGLRRKSVSQSTTKTFRSSSPSSASPYDPGPVFDLKSYASIQAMEMPDEIPCHPTVGAWRNMHLAKTVNTVRRCKEEIWNIYSEIYSEDDYKTFPAAQEKVEVDGSIIYIPSFRETFDAEWENWENDMKDRMNMRERIASSVGWREVDSSIADPSWRRWRSRLDDTSPDRVYKLTKNDLKDACRTFRAFVARKP